jgi:plastocyanin
MITRACTFGLASLFLAACGGGGDTGQGPGPLTVARTASASGDGQTGPVGAALASPIRVVVTSGGAPQAGAAVAWSAGSGGNVAPPSSTTDASGIASASWTLGHAAGAQSAQAAVSGATGSPVAFSASAVAGAAATMSAAGGNGQTGATGTALTSPLQVRIVDQFGNPVSGTAVAWASTTAGGSVTPTTSSSNTQGLAATVQTLPGTAGPASVTATAAGLAGSPVTFTSTAVVTTGANTIELRNTQFQPSTLTVAAGTTVTFVWNDGAVQHSIVPESPATIPSDPTPVAAPHTYSVSFTAPGTYRYYCSVHGDAGTGGVPTGMSGTIIVQ